MRLFIFLLLQFFIFLPLTSLASGGSKGPITQQLRDTEAKKTNIKKTYGKLPLYFIENQGQVDSRVKIYERGAGHATFFTGNGLILSLTADEAKVDKASHHDELKTDGNVKITTETLELFFVGANDRPVITAQDRQTGHVNYFVGNDKTKWRSDIPTYGALTYKDVYKNIDIKFYGNNREIEHDVIVRPGGDFSQVKFAYRGIKGLKITEAGDLEVSLAHGNIIERKPVIYQEIKGERVAVEGSYKILKTEEDGLFSYGFTVASYDGTKDLVIDPVLSYSTYLGGFSVDHGLAIAVDNTGAVYVTGYTASSDFPLAGSIQGVIGGGIDAFITKINASGSAIIYSTYLGGTGDDLGFGVAVDGTGAAYLTGYTRSSDFPVVTPALGALGIGGVFDAFVTKINPAGSAIVYSTYLGGTGEEWGRGIAVDSAGAAYVTGHTASVDFPLINPIQPALAGVVDAFITKVTPAGSAFVYSTYLGGTDAEFGNGIAVDSTGAAYLTGQTTSTDYPLASPIQGTIGGMDDAFITKVNSAGSALVYSTYLGGGFNDYGNGIAVDSSGAAYVTGQAGSTDFPVMNPIQGTNMGSWDAFVTKVNPAGSAYVYSTYLGGAGADYGNGIAVDSSGNAYVAGHSNSTDFPLAAAIQGANAGAFDVFVLNINPAGSSTTYSTYLGGASSDFGQGIAVDSTGTAYIAGYTLSADLPLATPIQATYGGGNDAFVFKLSGTSPPIPVITITLVPDAVTVARGSVLGYTVTVTNTTASVQCFQYWENVNLPGGFLYPANGSLLGYVPLFCLNGGASRPVHITHGLPFFSPIGTYTLNAYGGIFPIPYRVVVDSDSFTFNVVRLVGAPIQNPQNSWRLIENGFRK